MKLIDRLLLSELLVPFLVGTLAVVLMLIGNMLFFYAEVLFAKGVPVLAVAQMIVYHTPYLLVLTLPVATALSVSLAVNRLARDSEIVVLRNAGASLRRIFLPLLAAGLGISLLNFWLEEAVVPKAERQFRRIYNRIVMMQTAPLLRSNVVFRLRDYAFYIGMVENVRDGKAQLRDVQVWEMPVSGYARVILAPRAEYDDGIWRLYDAHVHLYGKDGFAIDAHARGEVTINLRVALEELLSPPTPEETNAAELRRQAQELERAGLPATRLWVGYYFKFSIPFACAVFALCSAPLALLFARAGSFMGVLLAIILVFLFWNTLLLARLLGNQGFLPPAVAAWAPNALFAAGGLLILWRLE
ncbi:MAG: LptF/LptG family permease [Armatimonadota bacterium]|nr:LptF/LptG family permease [bacterium]MCS7309303.1 LptF/LptG family permease [Armatimonadota bacterium]MDW8104000.1 LptF/LptG family permease [Armatimonadota bacterium]MDW8290111.1 LptF/LptG family permease [Armatimonadota bacterium]